MLSLRNPLQKSSRMLQRKRSRLCPRLAFCSLTVNEKKKKYHNSQDFPLLHGHRTKCWHNSFMEPHARAYAGRLILLPDSLTPLSSFSDQVTITVNIIYSCGFVVNQRSTWWPCCMSQMLTVVVFFYSGKKYIQGSPRNKYHFPFIYLFIFRIVRRTTQYWKKNFVPHETKVLRE